MYKILTALSADNLAEQAQHAMQNGWVPQGGLTMTNVAVDIAAHQFNPNRWNYYQAMVKIPQPQSTELK